MIDYVAVPAFLPYLLLLLRVIRFGDPLHTLIGRTYLSE